MTPLGPYTTHLSWYTRVLRGLVRAATWRGTGRFDMLLGQAVDTASRPPALRPSTVPEMGI
jgi:hypothetical protein